MSEPRTESRRAALLGALFAGGVLIVVLGAHVTPGGYHGHPRYVTPHSYPPGPRPTGLASASTGPSADASAEHAGSAWVSIPLLLSVVAIVLLVLLLATIALHSLRPPGRRAARRPGITEPTSEQAAPDLAHRLAQAIDAGIEQLADGPVADAIIACWLRLRDVAVAAGVAPLPSDTPEEFVSRVLGSVRVHPAPLHELAHLYREARFSVHSMTEANRTAARAALLAVGAELSPITAHA